MDLPNFSKNLINYSSNESDYYFPGSYVAAGTNATLQVTAIVGVWRVFIGAHTDFVSKLPLKRWPKAIRKIIILSVGLYDISSYFGGSVVFVSPSGISRIEALLSNVVSSPRYDSQNSLIKDSWNASRNSAGLWADISGKYITFTLPSSSVRNLQDPGPVTQLYDTLLQHYHNLRGTDIDRQRKMWVVTDKQTSNGAMHAGYPIVTHLDVSNPRSDRFLLNESGLRRDTWKFWGIFHELGHNMQLSEWTFDGTGEVTCNIFALYGVEKIGGIDLWRNPWLNNFVARAVDYINKGANFNVWKGNPGIALIIYAQLVEAFNWTTYKQVFRHYQNLSASERPKNNQEKIDKWFFIFSQKCNFNLAPLARYWGIPLSEGAVGKLNDLRLENFLPDDKLTSQTPARVRMVARFFPNLRNQTGG
ncbi:hypothetical protein HELRODRAFT_66031 [Helobdella robusta]|uniref:Peptidase M60 domain-containing protein n=1 Tax=Helobdella robusta TaxID=6412 RepID=T1FYG1_HELRO|nr:hypothetical protein HELRODRAFT_66031 [Helobdella robusta]ESO02573.1 hypothetical protein HELRODRAFT_66031 [Helobdella robusta]